LLHRDVKRVIEQDLGPNVEYYHLMDECYDYTDREYTYTLCPFDRAAQKDKHGGSETSLGYVSVLFVVFSTVYKFSYLLAY